jgi:hypothetical protein
MNQQASLPAGFDALEPFVAFWAADTAAERARRRDVSDDVSRKEFYTVMLPLVPKALEYLDSKPLAQHDVAEQRLMKLILSFGHVAMAVELHQEEEEKHAKNRPFMRITRATADLPAA